MRVSGFWFLNFLFFLSFHWRLKLEFNFSINTRVGKIRGQPKFCHWCKSLLLSLSFLFCKMGLWQSCLNNQLDAINIFYRAAQMPTFLPISLSLSMSQVYARDRDPWGRIRHLPSFMQNTPSEAWVNHQCPREGISDITRTSRCFSGNWGSLWTPWVDGRGGIPALSLLGLHQGFPSRRASFLLAFWPAHGVHLPGVSHPLGGSAPSKDGTQDAPVTSPRAAIVSMVTPEPVQKPDVGREHAQLSLGHLVPSHVRRAQPQTASSSLSFALSSSLPTMSAPLSCPEHPGCGRSVAAMKTCRSHWAPWARLSGPSFQSSCRVVKLSSPAHTELELALKWKWKSLSRVWLFVTP